MRTVWHNTETQIRATIYPFDDGACPNNRAGISVVRGIDLRYGEPYAAATINWPAIGAVNWGETKKFAYALDRASTLARAIEEHPILSFRVVGVNTEGKLVECVILGNNEGQVRDSIPKGFTVNFIVKVEPLEESNDRARVS